MLDDATILGKHDRIADFFGKAHFVGYEDAGHTFIDEITNDRQHFTDGFRIKC
ncbi:hypothetical protein D3C80_2012560 [compost metagenome]